jgi:hypothetical protein
MRSRHYMVAPWCIVPSKAVSSTIPAKSSSSQVGRRNFAHLGRDLVGPEPQRGGQGGREWGVTGDTLSRGRGRAALGWLAGRGRIFSLSHPLNRGDRGGWRMVTTGLANGWSGCWRMVTASQPDHDDDEPGPVVADPLATDHAEALELQQPPLDGTWRKVAQFGQGAIGGRRPVFSPCRSHQGVERVPGHATGEVGYRGPGLAAGRED